MNQRENQLPIIGITMGDPAGNGPELSLKALMHADLYTRCRPIIIGDAAALEQAKSFIGNPNLAIHRCKTVSDAYFTPGTVDVLHLDLIQDIQTMPIGKISAEAGMAAFLSVKKTIELALDGALDATVTNALNKEAMNLALEPQGMHFAGHTEIYAHYTNTKTYAMMLTHHDLRVIHVSTHCSLREACDRVKKVRVLDVIHTAYDACRQIGIDQPRIAVAGLNPHAGENGLFGTEEIDEILPAIAQARAEGIDAIGPEPADSLFSKALGGWFDIVVAMYHDQGHIPLKTVGFVYDREAKKWKSVEGVNVTLGLPIIRTSVDHGTGFDQAGKGTSSELSLLNAVDYAITMAQHRAAKA